MQDSLAVTRTDKYEKIDILANDASAFIDSAALAHFVTPPRVANVNAALLP